MVASFNTRKYYIFGAVGILLLLPLYYFWNPEGGAFPACPFERLTGLFCTGCGSQRALHDLLHGDIAGSFGHNLLFPPAILLLVGHFGNRILYVKGKSLWKSPLDGRYAPAILLGVVLVFTVLRNIPGQPFSFLAP
ncbi:Protein of unknown function [Robiginitalea myxolifaciens]|uniref:DUF2752 domain-containing protein n=1 Tax=Robiginitalea myxolifaciens TaxID=400055 RepID=A0A1I6H720_9FLAO|nr:DUF2752 domain-containing protein [Robiginitalea myxolifaciens]SFR50127.1 Protein of unknown function [Robiginitalea myxolifaciens]